MSENVILDNYSVTSIETITAYGVSDGSYLWTLDELQNFSLSQTEEKSDITGRGGRKLNTLKRNKSISISGANGYISTGLLETQTGGKTVKGSTTVHWTDYLTVTNSKATTSWKAVGTAGAEIKALYIRNADGTTGDMYEQVDSTSSAAVGDKVFAYDPATKVITFVTDAIEDDTAIVVQYMRQINAPRLDNYSDTFAGKAALFVDVMVEDKCANIFRGQFYIPTVDFSGEFSLEFGDNQSVHNFAAEALASGCMVNKDGKSLLWTYTIFGVNTEDAA